MTRGDLIEAIERAMNEWIECDWTHYNLHAEICEGGFERRQPCAECDAGDAAAREAQGYGVRAIAAIHDVTWNEL